MFHIFIDSFDQTTLLKNGFNPGQEDLHKQLKRRTKSSITANDVYNIGLSLWEVKITNKLACDIMKTQYQSGHLNPNYDGLQNDIIDTHSNQKIEKLDELIVAKNKLRNENTILKGHINNLEKKLDSFMEIKQQLASANNTIDNHPSASKENTFSNNIKEPS